MRKYIHEHRFFFYIIFCMKISVVHAVCIPLGQEKGDISSEVHTQSGDNNRVVLHGRPFFATRTTLILEE